MRIPKYVSKNKAKFLSRDFKRKRVSKITKYIMGHVLHMFVLQNESTMYEITLLLINIVTRPETV